jgi:orotate phosphoribosyltransferase
MFAQKLKNTGVKPEGSAKGTNVVVVEDLISTGNSSLLLLKLCALPQI